MFVFISHVVVCPCPFEEVEAVAVVVTEPPVETRAKTSSSSKKSKKSKGEKDKKGKKRKKSSSPAGDNLISGLDGGEAEVVTTSGGLLDLGMGAGELGQQQATTSYKLLAEDTNLIMVRKCRCEEKQYRAL